MKVKGLLLIVMSLFILSACNEQDEREEKEDSDDETLAIAEENAWTEHFQQMIDISDERLKPALTKEESDDVFTIAYLLSEEEEAKAFTTLMYRFAEKSKDRYLLQTSADPNVKTIKDIHKLEDAEESESGGFEIAYGRNEDAGLDREKIYLLKDQTSYQVTYQSDDSTIKEPDKYWADRLNDGETFKELVEKLVSYFAEDMLYLPDEYATDRGSILLSTSFMELPNELKIEFHEEKLDTSTTLTISDNQELESFMARNPEELQKIEAESFNVYWYEKADGVFPQFYYGFSDGKLLYKFKVNDFDDELDVKEVEKVMLDLIGKMSYLDEVESSSS